jgi:peptide/nickel transport system substrate-binding protein
MKTLPIVLVLIASLASACAPGNTPGGAPAGSTQAQPSAPRILVAGNVEDPKNMWDGINGGGGSGAREIGHMLNQYLAVIDDTGKVWPRLLSELPAVDKGTWKVSPDGKMEVTYKVRPGVTWHDGTPFTADDVVFSWEVGKDPQIPNGNQSAVRLIDKMVAVDPQTAVASWNQTYAFADRLEHREFFPLPKHLVEAAYLDSKETLISQPYFSTEYVGTGPFKLTSWDHGTSMEMVANENYFLGRPKIDRLKVVFIADPNTALANLQAGALNTFLPPGGPDLDRLTPLREEWKTTGQGTVAIESVRWRFLEPQKSSSLAQPADLTDPRIREALALATNRQELTATLLGDLGVLADSWLHPTTPYYSQIKDNVVARPFDPRRATALFAEVGWTPGPDGVLQKNGARFDPVLRYQVDYEKDSTIIRQQWKAVGIDAQLEVLSNVLLRDAEARAKYTGIEVVQNPTGGVSAVRRFATDQIPTAANKYGGTNRGAFNNPDWDQIGLRLRTSLKDDDRIQLEGDLLKVYSAQLPAFGTYFELQAVPVVGFKGWNAVTGAPHTGNIMHAWNVHEWELV